MILMFTHGSGPFTFYSLRRYKNVQRIASFLRGYRQAESRRVSREVTQRILGSVYSGGATSLEVLFKRMHTNNELNDDLIEYLGETVKQQEMVISRMGEEEAEGPKMLYDVLKMVYERVKAEAIWGGQDDKSLNLKLLAAALKASDENVRRDLIVKELFGRLERTENFEKLVIDSIEFVTDGKGRVSPGDSRNRNTLDVEVLNSVLSIARALSKEQRAK